jgi:hypothetical protein
MRRLGPQMEATPVPSHPKQGIRKIMLLNEYNSHFREHERAN